MGIKWIGEHVFDFVARFRNDVAMGWHGDADMIKILPRDFMVNEDAAGATEFIDDTGTVGVGVSNANSELVAIVPIPFGKKATHIDIFANQNRAIQPFSLDITDGSISTLGSAGAANTQLDMTDLSWGTDTVLGIKVTTTATSDLIFGGKVTIADI